MRKKFRRQRELNPRPLARDTVLSATLKTVSRARGRGFDSLYRRKFFLIFKASSNFFLLFSKFSEFFQLPQMFSSLLSTIFHRKKIREPRQIENLANSNFGGGPLEFELARFDCIEIYLADSFYSSSKIFILALESLRISLLHNRLFSPRKPFN